MAEWLKQASPWHEMYYYDLKVINSNPGWVKLEVGDTSVLSYTLTLTVPVTTIDALQHFETG